MSSIDEARAKRKALFTDAVRKEKKPEHIPIVSHAWTWKVIDAGLRFSEGLLDYDKLYQLTCEHHEKYHFDSYMEIGTAFLMRVAQAFGHCDYFIDDENSCLSYKDSEYLKPADFDQLLADGYQKYFWETLIPAKFGWDTKEIAQKRITAGMKEYKLHQAHAQRMTSQFVDTFGIPLIANGRYMCPAESIFWGLSGMKSMSIALRKSPDKLEQVMRELLPFTNGGFINTIDHQQPTDRACFDYRMTMLAQNIMNPRQFERFYWPYLKEFIDKITDADKIGLIFIEGSANHILDFLQDIPKGHFAIMFENVDLYEAKKKLGDRVALMGGYSTQLLNNGTKEECLTECEKIMDQVAYDGSYIFCANKMQGFKNDGNPENIRLVNDFFRNVRF